MEYKEMARDAKIMAESFRQDGNVILPNRLEMYSTAITELLARAEAAEARAEKAERERDLYKEMIYKERPCAFCDGQTGEWNVECIRCDNCITTYRPKFRLRVQKEE